MKLRTILPEKTYAPLGAAIELCVSRKTVYRWIAKGVLKATRIPTFDGGRRLAVPHSEIKRLLKYRTMIS